jgi:hypothetical protein
VSDDKGELMTTEWKPRYLVRKADGVDGPPIPDDEPVLVIRAQDVLADVMMAAYLAHYQVLGAYYDPAVVADLKVHRTALQAWQAAHADAIKVADR